MIAALIAAALAAALLLSLPRLFFGPTLYDRVLAMNVACLHAALIAAALSVMSARADWLDAAFALAFATFVLNVAMLKFFRARTFQAALASGGETR